MTGSILIVDDNAHVLTLMSKFLISKKYQVETGSDGAAAMDLLLRKKPNLLILDAFLPKIDGFELLKRLRGHPELKNIPVIMVTAFYKEKAHQERATGELGAAAYLIKPFPLHVLYHEVRKAFRKPEKTRSQGKPVQKRPVKARSTAAKDEKNASSRAEPEKASEESLHVPSSGNLAVYSMPVILNQLFSEGATGKLHLKAGGFNRSIFMLNGCPVWAESDVPDDTLSSYLMDSGKISSKRYEEIKQIIEQTGRRHDEVLLESGDISPHDLYEALQEHMKARILNCFDWQEGEFEFEPLKEFPKDVIVIKMEPARIIIDGIREHGGMENTEAYSRITDDSTIIPSREPLYTPQQLQLGPVEQQIVKLALSGMKVGDIVRSIKSRQKVRQILFSSTLGDLKAKVDSAGIVLRFLYALDCLGVFRIAAMKEKTAAAVDPKSFRHKRRRVRLKGRMAERRDRLLRDYFNLQGRDYFSLLGLSPEASEEEIRQAYNKKKRQYHPDNYLDVSRESSEEISDLIEKAEELYLSVEEAYATLMDPAKREEYVNSLGAPRP